MLLDENKILVVGGKNQNAVDLKSTEIINFSTNTTKIGADLIEPRSEFGLVFVGPQNSSQNTHILAIAGNSNGFKLKSVEKWIIDQERWEKQLYSLTKESSGFGYLAVPQKVLDPQFQGKYN